MDPSSALQGLRPRAPADKGFPGIWGWIWGLSGDMVPTGGFMVASKGLFKSTFSLKGLGKEEG